MRMVIKIIGIVAILMGLLWIGQGTGVVMWPASSFMLAQGQWAINGAVLAAIGAVMVWWASRR